MKTYNTLDIKRIVKHKDYTTAYEPSEKQNILVPDPFNLMVTTNIHHMDHFRAWQLLWKKSGYKMEFKLISNDGKTVRFETTCFIYHAQKKDLFKQLTWN